MHEKESPCGDKTTGAEGYCVGFMEGIGVSTENIDPSPS